MMKRKISNNTVLQEKPYDILVTGHTGFIGSKLSEQLTNKGYSITAISRKKIKDEKSIKFVKADALNYNELFNALKDIKVAFYLLHSMEGEKSKWSDFESRERIQAQNFLQAATKQGVQRIIFLGGLVNEEIDLSKHMRSRKEVGKILRSSNIPVTELCASVIIGPESGSYKMLRYLVERLRIMVCPRWVKSKAQPIAVSNVIDYLIGCLENDDTIGRTFEIGGPEILTYEELMRKYAAFLNKNLWIIEIPFLTPRLSSYWVDLVTPVKASLARPLVDSLIHDTVVLDNSIQEIIPVNLKTMNQSFSDAQE